MTVIWGKNTKPWVSYRDDVPANSQQTCGMVATRGQWRCLGPGVQDTPTIHQGKKPNCFLKHSILEELSADLFDENIRRNHNFCLGTMGAGLAGKNQGVAPPPITSEIRWGVPPKAPPPPIQLPPWGSTGLNRSQNGAPSKSPSHNICTTGAVKVRKLQKIHH